jgi:predicted O-linked N-acetylglucosamine transferase (SPINDLY family)
LAALAPPFGRNPDVPKTAVPFARKSAGKTMQDPRAQFQHALAMHQRGQIDEAAQIYKTILRTQPKYFDAIFALGIVYLQRKEFRAAEKQFGLANRINPNNSPLQNNLGSALLGLNRPQEALIAYDRAIAMDPVNWEAFYNRGNALAALKRFEDALASYDKSIALFPHNAEVHDNRGTTLANLQRFDEALASFTRAIQLNPNHARAYANRAPTHAHFKQYEKALNDYDKALALDPSLDYLFSNRFMMTLFNCRWDDGYDKGCQFIIEGIRNRTLKAEPFVLLSLPSTAEDQLACAARYIEDKEPSGPRMPWHGRRYAHDRIRIGYVSSDFHNHPVAHLVAGVLEAHDREHFMVHGFSTGQARQGDGYRERISQSLEVFADARTMGRDALTERIRAAEIDILIDLNGHTIGRRTDIFAARPAPVQVNYLGYPGTMGADYIDYIIADRHLIPEASRDAYSEKIIYLPDSYQANDSKRAIAAQTSQRGEHGLPEDGFVFCSFNNTFKITPDIFGVWMRLLQAVPGSVLWLFSEHQATTENLKREAERRNIPASRLVFAGRQPLDRHLARHRLADLFLDTRYYNAHTTASDALWAGLPVLTCEGETFAARVASSLLHAVGLPELVTHSLEEYENLALQLAADPAKLAAIKSKLANNLAVAPLFDTARYTRHLEAAYRRMWEISQKGKAPQSFAIEPLPR